ncbi:hypothetical protein DEO72_LG11g1754 [Vigna unguiculata]|uniref:Uncharacterized protein n=1 Tax=Vigna unguiculata TaxID=3917 RepID=A0A4D6NQE7_VIGUN|nr:hypothetical protein DEO72_LG11g1754 [Vigna unguiculata]
MLAAHGHHQTPQAESRPPLTKEPSRLMLAAHGHQQTPQAESRAPLTKDPSRPIYVSNARPPTKHPKPRAEPMASKDKSAPRQGCQRYTASIKRPRPSTNLHTPGHLKPDGPQSVAT